MKGRIRGFVDSLGPAGLFPLVVLFGLNTVDEFDRIAFGALAPEIKRAFDISNATFITIVSLAAAFSILGAVPIGYIADRYNRVRLSQVAALVWAATAVLTGFVPVLGWLVLVRFVGGIGRIVNEPVHPTLLSDYYPPGVLPRVFGVHRFANNLGNLAGPIAGLLVAWLGNWRPVFIILAVPTFVFVALSFRLHEPARGHTIDADQAAQHHEKVSAGEAFRRIRAIQSLRRTWAAAFLFGSGVLPFTAFLSLFFEDVYGFGPFGRGMLTLAYGTGGAIGLIIGSRLSQRMFSEGKMHLLPVVNGLMVVQFGASVLLMGMLPWVAASFFMAFMAGVGASGFLPAYLTMVALVAPPRLRAQAFSYSLLFFALGGIFLSRIAAAVGDAHGLRTGLIILAVFVASGGLVELSVRFFVARDMEQAFKSLAAQQAAQTGMLLACRGVDVAYDQVQVLFGVDFDVAEGEIVALLGTNGAGKSTLLKAISGTVDPIGGAIFFDERDITHADANATAEAGIAQVPGGRGIFPTLTVADNLRAAGWLYRKDPEYRKDAVERVLQHFPILRERWETPAGNLSGGEQQMLSLASAFIAKPKLLLIDELSLGLAPTVVERLLDIVRAIHDNGTTVVLVEQSVNTALQLAQRAVFMEKGEVRFSGPTADLLKRPDILRAVFLKGGAAAAGAAAGGSTGRTRRATLGRLERDRRMRLLDEPVELQTFGLTKRYGGITAVEDVDLELHRGEILGLIGPNGAGKTTIFDLISGFQPSDGGRIELHGAEITDWPAFARARAGLGRSFQDARLWHALTIREALAVACERHVAVTAAVPAAFGLPVVRDSEADVAHRVEELIELLALGAFRDKFVSELSTGSRRIVELAAILAHGPSVLILDEPSSGIAQRETEALGPLLRQVQSHLGCSMLVIEHDMPLITKLADRIVALESGRVIAGGTPDEVIHHPAVVESYLGKHFEELEAPRPRRRRRAAAGAS